VISACPIRVFHPAACGLSILNYSINPASCYHFFIFPIHK
jgi:hypothetical protein